MHVQTGAKRRLRGRANVSLADMFCPNIGAANATIHDTGTRIDVHNCLRKLMGLRPTSERNWTWPSFAPLVFTTSGGMEIIVTVVYKQLASMIAEKIWETLQQNYAMDQMQTQFFTATLCMPSCDFAVLGHHDTALITIKWVAALLTLPVQWAGSPLRTEHFYCLNFHSCPVFLPHKCPHFISNYSVTYWAQPKKKS